jgi:C4-dicarboxylate transporter
MAGTSPLTMMQTMIIFFTSCAMGVGIAAVGGSILDILENLFFSLGWFDLPSQWDSTSGYRMIVNTFYAMTYIIPLIGLFILIVSYIQRHTTDDDEDEYTVRGGRL